MRPLRIWLENFMSHQNTDIDCTQFRSALIVGKNRNNPMESNGVGKTTIFLAVQYALFGKTSTKVLDSIVRDGCDRARVTFEFEISGEVFKVVRSRSKKSSKSDVRLYKKESDWVDLTQKTSTETEIELLKIIKITLVAFQNSIHFAQSDLRGLASASANERKALLKEPLQLAIYSKYEKIARDNVSISLKDVERIKTLIISLGDPCININEYKIQIIEHENKLKEASVAQKESNDLLDIALIGLSELKNSNSNELTTLRSDLDRALVEKDKIEKSIFLGLQLLIKAKQNKDNSTLYLSGIEKNISIFSDKLVIFKEKNIRKLQDVQADREKILNKEIEGSGLIAKLESDKKRLTTSLPGGDVCNHCKQIVSKEHRDAYEIKESDELVIVENNLIKYNNVLTSVKTRRLEFDKELQDINIHDRQLTEINHSLAKYEIELNQYKLIISNTNEQISLKSEEISQFKNQLVITLKQVEDLSKAIDDKNEIQINENINKLQIKISLLRTTHANNSKETSEITTFLGVLAAQLKTAEENLAKLDGLKFQLKDVEKLYFIKLKVLQAFSSSGIPTLIINTILDDLQIMANQLLSDLRPGMELKFSIVKNKADGQTEDTLDISYRVNGCEREYEQLSGGQKVFVTLSLKLGLSIIIQHRIGVDIKFLELDEVDQSLDAAGVAAFAEVIKKWQEKFTIFVVTHNNSLKDKFTHAILVEADGTNGSSGKVVTSW